MEKSIKTNVVEKTNDPEGHFSPCGKYFSSTRFPWQAFSLFKKENKTRLQRRADMRKYNQWIKDSLKTQNV